MRFKLIAICCIAAAVQSLPAPIIERGGRAPDIRHFSEQDVLNQTATAKPMGPVGDVPTNTSEQRPEDLNADSKGGSNIASASAKLREGAADSGAVLKAANKDLQDLASYRWWKTPMYAAVLCLAAFAAMFGLKVWADKKLPAPIPASGQRKKR